MLHFYVCRIIAQRSTRSFENQVKRQFPFQPAHNLQIARLHKQQQQRQLQSLFPPLFPFMFNETMTRWSCQTSDTAPRRPVHLQHFNRWDIPEALKSSLNPPSHPLHSVSAKLDFDHCSPVPSQRFDRWIHTQARMENVNPPSRPLHRVSPCSLVALRPTRLF